MRFYPGFGGSNRLDFFSPYGVSMSLLFFSSVNSSRTGHKSDAWRLRVSKSLTQGMWHQSLITRPDAAMTGWLYIALRSLTLLGSYTNGRISHLKISRWMSSDPCRHSCHRTSTPLYSPHPLSCKPFHCTSIRSDKPHHTIILPLKLGRLTLAQDST